MALGDREKRPEELETKQDELALESIRTPNAALNAQAQQAQLNDAKAKVDPAKVAELVALIMKERGAELAAGHDPAVVKARVHVIAEMMLAKTHNDVNAAKAQFDTGMDQLDAMSKPHALTAP